MNFIEVLLANHSIRGTVCAMGRGTSTGSRPRAVSLRCPSALAALLAVVGGARGDLAHVQYHLKISDPVLTPGETQTIELWWEFKGEWTEGFGEQWFGTHTPGKGAEIPAKYYSVGLFSVSLFNGKNAQTGVYSDQLFHNFLAGDPGVLNANSDLMHIVAVSGFPPSPFIITQNPTFVWKVDWTPTSYDPRTVKLDLIPDGDSLATVGLLQNGGFYNAYVTRWFPSLGDSISFKVIPAPATLALPVLALAALSIRWRR